MSIGFVCLIIQIFKNFFYKFTANKFRYEKNNYKAILS